MLCSRGQLLLMLDADGASRITDLEKLEAQVSCHGDLCNAYAAVCGDWTHLQFSASYDTGC